MRRLAVALAFSLSGCASSFAMSASASRPASPLPLDQLAESVALREKRNLVLDREATAIYVESVGLHHTRRFFSTVALRGGDGSWSVSTIGEETSGLLTLAPNDIPETARRLTPDEGRMLDGLLASRALYSERPVSSGEVGVGSPEHVMEVATPSRRIVVRWTGKLRGHSGRVADIVLGSE